MFVQICLGAQPDTNTHTHIYIHLARIQSSHIIFNIFPHFSPHLWQMFMGMSRFTTSVLKWEKCIEFWCIAKMITKTSLEIVKYRWKVSNVAMLTMNMLLKIKRQKRYDWMWRILTVNNTTNPLTDTILLNVCTGMFATEYKFKIDVFDRAHLIRWFYLNALINYNWQVHINTLANVVLYKIRFGFCYMQY